MNTAVANSHATDSKSRIHPIWAIVWLVAFVSLVLREGYYYKESLPLHIGGALVFLRLLLIRTPIRFSVRLGTLIYCFVAVALMAVGLMRTSVAAIECEDEWTTLHNHRLGVTQSGTGRFMPYRGEVDIVPDEHDRIGQDWVFLRQGNVEAKERLIRCAMKRSAGWGRAVEALAEHLELPEAMDIRNRRTQFDCGGAELNFSDSLEYWKKQLRIEHREQERLIMLRSRVLRELKKH